MLNFTYTSAQTDKDAIAGHDAQTQYLAGGTSLLDLMKLHVENPPRLIDINPLPLNKVETMPDGSVRIGAMVRNSDLAYDETIQAKYPVLSSAILQGASAQLRNMASTGGNLLQKTRCYYYRDTAMPCNKREPGTGCSAIEGFNRIHAILGTSKACIATHPSDMCVAMAALDATVQVKGPNGERTIPFANFHRLPGDTPQKDTNLESGELITYVTLPALPFAARSHYLKVRDRASYAFALVSVASALDIQGGVIKQARIALGGVAHKPWRAEKAEKLLIGKPASETAFHIAAEEALRGAHTFKYNAFKIELAKRAIVRCLTTVGEMA